MSQIGTGLQSAPDTRIGPIARKTKEGVIFRNEKRTTAGGPAVVRRRCAYGWPPLALQLGKAHAADFKEGKSGRFLAVAR